MFNSKQKKNLQIFFMLVVFCFSLSAAAQETDTTEPVDYKWGDVMPAEDTDTTSPAEETRSVTQSEPEFLTESEPESEPEAETETDEEVETEAEAKAEPEEESDKTGGQERYIGVSKSFLPMFFPSPVIASHLSLVEGVVYMSQKMEDILYKAFYNESHNYKAEVMGYGTKLGVGIGFLDWFGIDLMGEGFAAAGINDRSSFYFGAIGSYDFEGILKFMVFERKEDPGIKITLGLRGEYNRSREISPLHIMKGMLDELKIYVENRMAFEEIRDTIMLDIDISRYLLIKIENFVVAPAFMFGLGASEYFSALIYIDIGYYWSAMDSALMDRKVENTIGSRMGIDLTLDLGPVFPLALQAEYSTSFGWMEGEEDVLPDKHNIGAGLYYSGSSDIQIGIAGFTMIYPDNPDNRQYYEADICFRYFF